MGEEESERERETERREREKGKREERAGRDVHCPLLLEYDLLARTYIREGNAPTVQALEMLEMEPAQGHELWILSLLCSPN